MTTTQPARPVVLVDDVRAAPARTVLTGPTRVNALDGLRGLAIAMVIPCHATAFLWPSMVSRLLPGGFLGLDLFFVLSGYLITTLILERRAKGERGLRKFYIRRALRILPALVAMLFVVAVYVLATGEEGAGDVAFSIGTTLTNFASWILHFLPSWFAHQHFVAPMAIVWSLAVEERFYAIWPALLLVMLRLGWSRRTILAVVAAGVLVSAVQNHLLFAEHHLWQESYFRTDARVGELLIGSGLALAAPMVARIPPRLLAAAATLWMAFFLIGALVFHPATRVWYYGGFTFVALGAAVLVTAAADGGPLICRLLAWRPLVVLGTLSYSLYLWHYPIFFVVADRAPHNVAVRLALGLGITAVVVPLSHRFIELPALALKHRFIRDDRAPAPRTLTSA